ncbi:MAG: 30S ribosomal protein S16 [bacterium ADurb.Bin400]|nr:MAG: 30S ribosomal protein S16 [bacterium ADurb.Bin400]
MLAIRLTRVGKKNSPAYRVVVADKSRAVKRKFIEILGHYNPTMQPKTVEISKERANFWMEKGAQPSDTVRNLMVDLGILNKDQKAAKVYGKSQSKKAAQEEK